MADENKVEHINLKVAGQDGSVVQIGLLEFTWLSMICYSQKLTRIYFKIKKHTPLRKLMQAYCDRQGLQLTLVRFRFDGNPVKVSSCVLAGLFKFSGNGHSRESRNGGRRHDWRFPKPDWRFCALLNKRSRWTQLPSSLLRPKTHVFLHRPFAGSLAHKHEKKYLINFFSSNLNSSKSITVICD